MVRDHEWKQDILGPKSQWLEDQEASRLAPGDSGVMGSFLSVELFACTVPAYLPGGFRRNLASSLPAWS